MDTAGSVASVNQRRLASDHCCMNEDTAFQQTSDQPAADHETPSEPIPIGDRRRHKRFRVQRAGKVFRRSTQQYLPAGSRDLSFGGALLEIESERGVGIGEIIDVGLAMSSKAVVPSASLLRGIVVRAEAIGEHRQLVAVRYLHREGLAEAA